MTYTKITSHYDVAQIEYTPVQFREKAIYQAILKAFSDEVQILEDTLWQMNTETDLDHAVGQQLDNKGIDLVVPRPVGMSDTDYRALIYSTIFKRRSDGTADFVSRALMRVYNSPVGNVYEHITPLTGGVVVRVNQTVEQPSAVKILKAMTPTTIACVAVLRDPTPLGYAWTPVEVEGSSNRLVRENSDWFVTGGQMGIVVSQGSGTVAKNMIGTLGEPGMKASYATLDTKVDKTPPTHVDVDSQNFVPARPTDNQLLALEQYTLSGGVFGVMAEVSQLRNNNSPVEGEQ